jgi:hypothetical protein
VITPESMEARRRGAEATREAKTWMSVKVSPSLGARASWIERKEFNSAMTSINSKLKGIPLPKPVSVDQVNATAQRDQRKKSPKDRKVAEKTSLAETDELECDTCLPSPPTLGRKKSYRSFYLSLVTMRRSRCADIAVAFHAENRALPSSGSRPVPLAQLSAR